VLFREQFVRVPETFSATQFIGTDPFEGGLHFEQIALHIGNNSFYVV
jgi:hypothetical protein